MPRFAHDEIRLIVRPTRFYSLLLSESFHPDLLRDALERDRFFDRLWLGIEQHPCLARVIPAERHDLLRGDVPMFTTYPDSRTIFTTEGEPLLDFFDEPSLELVKKRLQQLDERDFDKQIWFIRASLATILMGTDQLTCKELQIKPGQTQVSRERLITAARAIGERISKLALCSEYGANWIGITLLKEHTAKSVSATQQQLLWLMNGASFQQRNRTGLICASSRNELLVVKVRAQLRKVQATWWPGATAHRESAWGVWVRCSLWMMN